MCTVTFIPQHDKCFITSNRDEKAWRKKALPPAAYHSDDVTLLYPKDADAGGTWIALNENGNTAVLLNGAFKKHTPAPPYERSRGLVLLDVIKNKKPVTTFQRLNFKQTEPFTLIFLTGDALFECRWDGIKKYFKQLRNNQPYIWSSATLYDDDIMKKRETWFAKWLRKNSEFSAEEILQFHLFAGDGDSHNDLHMNRDGVVFTVSVTNIELHNDKGIMTYLDTKDKRIYKKEIDFITQQAEISQ